MSAIASSPPDGDAEGQRHSRTGPSEGYVTWEPRGEETPVVGPVNLAVN